VRTTNDTLIPVTFTNPMTAREVAAAALPWRPMAGDIVYVGERSYEVSYLVWRLADGAAASIAAYVRPWFDDEGERPDFYPEELGRRRTDAPEPD